MASIKKIGVTGNSRRFSPSWLCTKIALALVGDKAYRISLRHDPGAIDFDGLVIGGGDDISPEHYGHDITAKVKPNPKRDELEMRWARKALQDNIPILGICRGAQLINVVLGGTLFQDVRPIRIHTYNRPGLLPTKQVALLKTSFIAGICGKDRIRVNSLHNQAIDKTGKDLRVVGKDLDGIVQAVESTGGQQILGVQWHPEYLFYVPSQLALFRWLAKGN